MVKHRYIAALTRIGKGLWTGNKVFMLSLGRGIRQTLLLVFGLHILILLFFLLYIPFHYDEAWSYDYFSSQGIWQTMHFYPLPNNHIFYNLVACLFVWLPLPAEISTRLPSLIAHCITLYYFFKLSCRYFSAGSSIAITLLLAVSYPIVLYAIFARGYSFLVCATVLMLYAADHLVFEPARIKFRLVYFMAMALGLYSLPSFLYAVLPMNAALLILYLSKASKRYALLFIFDNLKALLVILLLYWPVVAHNDIHRLIEPNGEAPGAFSAIAGMMPVYFLDVWHFLTGVPSLPFYVYIVLIIALIYAGIKNRHHCRFLALTTVLMLLSPPLIVSAHRVLPFSRVWIYLSVPLMLAVGFLINLPRMPPLFPLRVRRAALWVFCGALMVASYIHFMTGHARQYAIDYHIRDCFEKIRPAIGQIRKIAYTESALEFYPAEDLLFQCGKRNAVQRPEMQHPVLDSSADVIILAPGPLSKAPPGYAFISSFPNAYTLFIRERLLRP